MDPVHEGLNIVDFHYEKTTEGGSGATVGVQSDTGGSGSHQWSHNQAGSITNGLSLSVFAPNPNP